MKRAIIISGFLSFALFVCLSKASSPYNDFESKMGIEKYSKKDNSGFLKSDDGENWDKNFGLQGINGLVYAITKDNEGNLYIGGSFQTAYNTAVSNIAKWDGAEWSDLGGINGAVRSLIIDDDGVLFAGGNFSEAGGVAVNNIAGYDGGDWFALESGLNDMVYDMKFHENGDLYVVGSFTHSDALLVNRIAQWDGDDWFALGQGLNEPAYKLAFNSINELVVVGDFNQAGGITANRIAKWDGTDWSTFSTAFNATALAVAIDGSDNIYVGGFFTQAGLTPVNRIAFWDGSQWQHPANGVNSTVLSLTIDDDDNLYAGGWFWIAGGTVETGGVAKWDGAEWSALGDDVFVGNPYELYIDQNDSLYVGGFRREAGNQNFAGIAVWNETQWEPIYYDESIKGINGNVYELKKDSDGNIYAGGSFFYAGQTEAMRIAKYNGTEWEALGSGIDDEVYAIEVDNDGNVYVGGYFKKAGETDVNNLAMWNGTEWEAFSDGTNQSVTRIKADNDGNIYVSGYFTEIHGLDVGRVAKWDGDNWNTLNGGLNGGVRDIAIDNVGNLYVVGDFTMAGGDVPVNNVAKWNGTQWLPLGEGIDNGIWAIAVDENNNIFIAGGFEDIGGQDVLKLAMWDGTEWETIIDNIYGEVNRIKIGNNGFLYMVGQFSFEQKSSDMYDIAYFDGNNWFGLGGGTNGNIYSISIDDNYNIYIGGDFAIVDGIVSNSIAAYLVPYISLSGNGNEIEEGDNTPEFNNNTDFGLVQLCDTDNIDYSWSRTFTIINDGQVDMTVHEISVTGDDADDFNVSSIPGLVAAGSTDTFDVTYHATELGEKTAIITVYTDAFNIRNFSFDIKAETSPDQNPPFIVEAPSGIIEIDANQYCQASLPDYTEQVIATDDCADPEDLIITQIPSPGTNISGVNDIIIEVADLEGNITEINFQVEVIDVSDPVVICKQNQTRTILPGESFYIVDGMEFDPESVEDNCGIASVENDFNTQSTLANANIPIGTHSITWTVTDEAGNFANCVFELVISTDTGIDVNPEEIIKIFPNPVSDELIIELGTYHSEAKVVIEDINGRIVYKENISGRKEINTFNIPSGTYFVRIKIEDNWKVSKIIVE